MTRNRNARATQTSTQQNDVRDTTNPVNFPTNDSMQNTASVATITLKSIIATHKIKTDPKLIRRVLRKYYAQKINHQHRDAWVFPVDHTKHVVELIDKHCRAGVASK